MARASTPGIRPIDSNVVEFLSGFARNLIAAGITLPRFDGIARLAFFNAASTKAKFGNNRLNHSAVAAMTGLTRLQVRQFAKQADPPLTSKRDRIDNVVDGWSSDGAFITHNNLPRRLRLTGSGNTFGALVRKYGGDVPPRSMLRELERQGYVTLGETYVSLKRGATQTRDEARLRRISRALADLLGANEAGAASPSPLRTLALEVSYPASSDRGRAHLQRRAAEGLKVFLAGLQAAGVAASLESPPGRRQKGRVTRSRVVLVTEEVGT
jgi:hypothetical protein